MRERFDFLGLVAIECAGILLNTDGVYIYSDTHIGLEHISFTGHLLQLTPPTIRSTFMSTRVYLLHIYPFYCAAVAAATSSFSSYLHVSQRLLSAELGVWFRYLYIFMQISWPRAYHTALPTYLRPSTSSSYVHSIYFIIPEVFIQRHFFLVSLSFSPSLSSSLSRSARMPYKCATTIHFGKC